MNKGKEETMVAHKVALRMVLGCLPTTPQGCFRKGAAGTLGVPAVFFMSPDFPAAVSLVDSGGGT
jgi:hypothetical protein